LEFKKEVRYAEILNPLKNFKLERQTVEHRFDPLTAQTTIVTSGRFSYAKRLFETDKDDLLKTVEQTRQNCPFCPERIFNNTPKFPSNLVPGGRIVEDEVVIFPGLFAHMDFNALAVVSKEHYLEIDELAPEKILKVFKGGLRYFIRVNEVYPEVKYAAFVGNYLPPSGSSIIHPHVQLLASDQPFYMLKLLIEKSKEYFGKIGRNYWLELVGKEREIGDRYIGEIKDVVWITPFAPTKTFEVWGIDKVKDNFKQLNDEDLRSFAEGLSKVFKFYKQEGVGCFNFTLYSGPLDEQAKDHFKIGLRVSARFGFKQPFINDVWGLQSLLLEGESYETPEAVARKLREFFK
jgi:galactose-1-phosphate uridylyltransferase